MEWISIKDKLPEINLENKKANITVLGYDGNRIWYLTFTYLYKFNIDATSNKPTTITTGYIFHTYCPKCDCSHVKKDITHWMYIPEPPKKKKKISMKQ